VKNPREMNPTNFVFYMSLFVMAVFCMSSLPHHGSAFVVQNAVELRPVASESAEAADDI